MGKISRPPSDDRDWDELKRRVDNLETGNRAGHTTIHGQMLLGAGSSFRVRDAEDETDLTYIGPVYIAGFPDPTDAVILRRADGTRALEIVGGDPTQQYIAIVDRAGHTILSDDTVSGSGLGRPWLPIPWRDESTTSTTSTSFVPLGSAVMYKQHPKATIQLMVTAPAGVSVEYKVNLYSEDLTTVLAQATVAGAVSRQRETLFDLEVPGYFGEVVYFEVEARVAAGAGSVGAIFASIWAKQS